MTGLPAAVAPSVDLRAIPVSELAPHAAPMLLLDRALRATDETLTAEVVIRASSMFYADGGVGSWVGVEYMAQAVAAHAGHLARRAGSTVKAGFLLGSRKYTTSAPRFELGAVLHVHVKQVLRGENGLGAFECSIVPAGDTVASASASASVSEPLAHATLTVFQPGDVNEFLAGLEGTA